MSERSEREETGWRQVVPSALLVQVVSSVLSALLIAALLGFVGLLKLPGTVKALDDKVDTLDDKVNTLISTASDMKDRLVAVETRQKRDGETVMVLLEASVRGESRAYVVNDDPD